jgi:hypothetical protein
VVVGVEHGVVVGVERGVVVGVEPELLHEWAANDASSISGSP